MREVLGLAIENYQNEIQKLQCSIDRDWNCLASLPESYAEALSENQDIVEDLVTLIADIKHKEAKAGLLMRFKRQLETLSNQNN